MNTAATTGPAGHQAGAPRAARVPHRLLDFLIVHMGLKNDAALARLLAVSPASLSKIRHGKVNISADILLRSHETLQIPVADLRRMLDDSDDVPRPGAVYDTRVFACD